MKTVNRIAPQVSTGSMADIAFLLLTFYLMTTVILEHRGLPIMLPPHVSNSQPVPWKDRNLFTIQINSSDQFLIEGEPRQNLAGVRNEIQNFILNPSGLQTLSESPLRAVVSIKTDRGTSYAAFLEALDEVQAGYYELYGQRVGLSAKEFRQLDLDRADHRKLYDKARANLPMNISIAEPTTISN